VVPEDDDLSGNVEENIKVVEDSDASKEGKEEEEEDDDDDALFIAKRRWAAADELTDTAESGPSGRNEDDVDRIPLAKAAPEASTAPPPKKPPGFFADENDLSSGS
jgi:hypothetical protein